MAKRHRNVEIDENKGSGDTTMLLDFLKGFMIPATVSGVEDITPHMRRITLSHEKLRELEVKQPGQWLSILFPAIEGNKQQNRAYTIRAFDADRGTLAIDFALHGDIGCASRWALRARAGDVLHLSKPRPGYNVDPAKQRHVLIGDATFLPAASEILAALPEGVEANAFFEVAAAADEQALRTSAHLTLKWLHAHPHFPGATGQLEREVRLAKLSFENCQVWLAGESSMIRAIRKYLLTELGLERSALQAAGYWKVGAAGHRERG